MTVGQVFQVDIEKELNGEFWSNRYFLTASSITIASSDAQGIIPIERSIHDSRVFFTKMRVSTPAPNDNQFIVTPINVAGTRVNSTALLPLWNVLRIDFPAGFGRPNRKLYRGVLTEADVEGSLISNAQLAGLVDAAVEALSPTLTERDGTVLGDGTMFPRVQMRQLRRGTRKRQTPVIVT